MRFLGLTNYSPRATSVTLRGGVEVATLPPANVTTDEPTEVARVPIADPWRSAFRLTFDPRAHTGGFALVNTPRNLHQVRIRTSDSELAFTADNYERCLPSSIPSSLNVVSGTVADIDEDPSSADANRLILGLDTTNHLRIRFTDPVGGVLRPGYARQCFTMLCSSLAAGSVASVTASLYENGSLRTVLGTRLVTISGAAAGTGQTVSWPFDATSLTSVAATNIELHITADRVVGTSSLVVEAAALTAELNLSLGGGDYDSGWLDIPIEAGDAPTRSFHHIAPANLLPPIATVFVYLRANAVNEFEDGAHVLSEEAIGNALRDPVTVNTLDLGCLVFGDVFQPVKGIRQGTLRHRVISTARTGTSQAGQAYSADAFRYREAGGQLILTRDELDYLTDRLDWRKGTSAPFYIALEPTLDQSHQRFTSFWAVLQQAGEAEGVSAFGGGGMTWRKAYTFRERL